MNQIANSVSISRGRQDSIDILFRGLKRKVTQTSYSKIKNSYKKKPVQHQQSHNPLAVNLVNRSKLKLSVISNRVADPQQAHDELINLKQANHQLSEKNAELLKKIRKQQKIEEIYRKKFQGKQLYELDFFRVMQIKLLLEVETLENNLEEKQSLYQQKASFIKAHKHSFTNEILQSRMLMYELLINSPEDLAKIHKAKKSQLKEKQHTYHKIHQQVSKVKHQKNTKNQILNQIKQEIKELKEMFKSVEAQTKRDKNGTQMANITSLMSSLMTNSQKSPTNKEASSKILKNNVSSISVKNRNNIEQIEKEIAKIKEEYDLYNNEIQQFMDETIKKKIMIYKEIHEIEEKQRAERELENRNSWTKKQGPIVLTKLQRSTNPLKNPILMEINS